MTNAIKCYHENLDQHGVKIYSQESLNILAITIFY